MKNKESKIIITIAIISIAMLAVTNAAATPSVKIDPKHPKPQETVTFTATFSEMKSLKK